MHYSFERPWLFSRNEYVIKKMCIIRPISLLVEFVPSLSDILMLPESFDKRRQTTLPPYSLATNYHFSLFFLTQGSLKIWTEHSLHLCLLKSKLLTETTCTVWVTYIEPTSGPNISAWNQYFWAQIQIIWLIGHGKLTSNCLVDEYQRF